MKTYNVIIQDIYEKDKQKFVKVNAINSQIAHKEGLKDTNALREEIALIKDSSNNTVYTFRDGFFDTSNE